MTIERPNPSQRCEKTSACWIALFLGFAFSICQPREAKATDPASEGPDDASVAYQSQVYRALRNQDQECDQIRGYLAQDFATHVTQLIASNPQPQWVSWLGRPYFIRVDDKRNQVLIYDKNEKTTLAPISLKNLIEPVIAHPTKEAQSTITALSSGSPPQTRELIRKIMTLPAGPNDERCPHLAVPDEIYAHAITLNDTTESQKIAEIEDLTKLLKSAQAGDSISGIEGASHAPASLTERRGKTGAPQPKTSAEHEAIAVVHGSGML